MKRFTYIIFTLLFSAQIAQAADHLDGIAVMNDPAADITDTFAWLKNQDELGLILNVFPNAIASSKFSDQVQYVFHVNSVASYGAAADVSAVICTFNIDQMVSCTLGKEANIAASVTKIDNADASSSAGVMSSNADFKIFTGLRNDPFYFDIENFNLARTTVRDAASSLSFDGAGCPTVDNATRSALVNTLVGSSTGSLSGTNSPAEDFFGNFNVLSIVIQADKELFGNGPIYSVWASTHNKS